MIQAVKVESNALDSMRDKLKEVDNLRSQISAFTKRLIDADQNNLNLKAQLVKSQEAYGELKKQKAEVESNMVPLRQELNRTKEILNKERQVRQQLQQENQMLKEQFLQYQKVNENLDREVKQIPALMESNEILKQDLDKVRKRFKEEKAMMQKHIKGLESGLVNIEVYKQEVRNLAIRLMEVTGGPGGMPQGGMPQPPQQQVPPPQVTQQSQFIAGNAINMRNMQLSMSQPMYPNGGNVNDSYEEDDDDDGNGGNDSDYDTGSYADDMGLNGNVNSSIESMSSLLGGSSVHNMGSSGVNNVNSNNGGNNGGGGGGTNKKKKKVKRVVSNHNNNGGMNGGGGGGTGGGGGGNVHMMQAIPSQGNGGGFMLPRLH